MTTQNPETPTPSTYDRRLVWQPPRRPDWLREVNALGLKMDMSGIIPLDEQSLLDQARRNTGLDDFGDNEWLPHFRLLLQGIKDEADLNFFGRILTRSDLLIYLEARLSITDTYKRHPEIDQEVIKEPIFIVGSGRAGTTILHEVLSLDPQFRSVRRWEALFPCPPPEEATYETDQRIEKTQNLLDVIHAVSPAWSAMHVQGAKIPVEDIEFTYCAFFSEVWPLSFQLATYEKYFADQDPSYHYFWHKRILKLLQWKFKKPHWLFKNPTFTYQIPHLLKTYPDARLIFPHRDPIVGNDSSVDVMGNIYYWRTDDPWGKLTIESRMLAKPRAELWDRVIEWMNDGTIDKDKVSNIIFQDFVHDPENTIRKIYSDLRLDLQESVINKMKNFLSTRPDGGKGRKHAYSKLDKNDLVLQQEREIYKKYQEYFGVPSEY